MTTPRWKPAVTVAAMVERDGLFLLVEEDTSDGIRWNQPAGHLDPGESIIDGAIRETLEETAHVLTPTALLGTYLAPAGDKAYLRFAIIGTVGEPVPGLALDVGIHRAFWLDADTLRARPDMHRNPVVMRCVEDYLAHQRAGTPFLPLTAMAYLDPEPG